MSFINIYFALTNANVAPGDAVLVIPACFHAVLSNCQRISTTGCYKRIVLHPEKWGSRNGEQAARRQGAGLGRVHCDRSEYFHLLTFQAKMFPIYSVISYQCLDSNLANIKEKVNSTMYFTPEMNEMPIHYFWVSLMLCLFQEYIYIYIFIHTHYTLHRTLGHFG